MWAATVLASTLVLCSESFGGTSGPVVLYDRAGMPQRIVVGPAAVLNGLSPRHDEIFLVVAFLGVHCPLCKLYAGRLGELAVEFESRGVRFVGVDPNAQDDQAEISAFVRDHQLPFPLWKDVDSAAVQQFGATRTPEVVVIDARQRVCYRGRIDDQYSLGVHRDRPTREHLRSALGELIATGGTASKDWPAAEGCLIHIAEKSTSVLPDDVTYSRHIAPLMYEKCVRCHRPGQAAPFSLNTYEEVVGFSAMIHQVVATGRMPPWPAAGLHGQFTNDVRLTMHEEALLLKWLKTGFHVGDLSKSTPLTPYSDHAWQIGTPDAVVRIPQEFRVPAQGVVEYQYFEVDPGFAEDRWVSAVEVRPTNRQVVHHCNVFLKPPGSSDAAEAGSLGSVCLTAMAAGTEATVFRTGAAKRIPAGWKLLFVVHYTTVGTEQVDRLSLGLKFADPRDVAREIATRLVVDEQLCIPPGAAEHRVTHTAVAERELDLLAMFPHMHLRGKSFRYEAEFPDGRRETLLDVPRWDFQWQPRYELAEPVRLPAGTKVHCTAVYDNSAANPANPDPMATVRTGPLSTDEMFNAYYDVMPVEADYPASVESSASPAVAAARTAWPMLAIGFLWWGVRRGRSQISPAAAA